MKIKKLGKKALYIYGPMLIIIVIIILSAAFINLKEKYDKIGGKGEDKVIGVKQFTLLKTFQQGEKALYYIDYAAKYSAEQSVYDLASAGGWRNSPCGYMRDGSSDEYALWQTKEKECYPSSTKEAFSYFFNQNIQPYLSSYPDNVVMPDSYTLDFKDTKILGTSVGAVVIDSNTYTSVFASSSYVAKGECGDVVNTAIQYLGCAYSYTPMLLAPGECVLGRVAYKGLTCATFVESAYQFSKKIALYGNGNSICDDSSGMHKFSDSGDLQPGDVISVSGGSAGYGHTGIFVGKGKVSNGVSGKESFCFTEFTPDENGDLVFIHSIGPVCYSNLNQFLSMGYYKPVYCRHDQCINNAPTSASAQTSSTTTLSSQATTSNPAEQPIIVKIKTYYTPLETDFKEWYGNSELNMPRQYYCNYPNRQFFEEVKCQGFGKTKDGKICKAEDISTSKLSSKCLDTTKEMYVEGSTYIGTPRIAHKTIAVSTALVPVESPAKTVYLDFGANNAWTGCYAAEDLSHGSGTDVSVYTGMGKDSVRSALLHSTATAIVKTCDISTQGNPSGFINADLATKGNVFKYTIPSSFKLTLDYKMFDKFSSYTNEVKLALENFKKCIKKNELKDCEKDFTVVEVPDESVFLKFDRTDDSFSPLYIAKKPVTYRFALQLADIVPPPVVDGVAVGSIQKLPESSFLKVKVKWNKNPAEDLHHYSVYCSESLPAALTEATASAWIAADKTEAELLSCGGASFEFGKKYYIVVTGIDKKLNELDKIVDGRNFVEISPVCCMSALSLLGVPEGALFIANKDCGASLPADSKKCLV